MKAVFIELPAFERHREDYLDDDGFTRLQVALMVDPAAGDVIAGPAVFANCASPTLVEARASAAACG